MKIALWIHFVTTVTVCFLLAFYLDVARWVFRDFQGGKPLPALAEFVIENRHYFYIIPFPWLGGAIWLTRQKSPPAGLISIYGASVLWLNVTLFAIVLIASALGLIQTGGSMG